jgi:hypothetical protein
MRSRDLKKKKEKNGGSVVFYRNVEVSRVYSCNAWNCGLLTCLEERTKEMRGVRYESNRGSHFYVMQRYKPRNVSEVEEQHK